MKTNQEMVRYIDNFSVIQQTNDGYFDANELLGQWNSITANTKREMKKFLDNSNTLEFISALKEEVAQSQKCDMASLEVVKMVKGRNTKKGKTKDQVYMHPYLFTKFAMWINPRFEVKVIKFVTDEMIRYRNDAGDAYKELSSAVMRIVPRDFMPKAMQKIGEALNWVIFNSHERDLRNKHGEEQKQRELYQLEKKIADLINEGFISTYDSAIGYLRGQYQKRNYPPVFN